MIEKKDFYINGKWVSPAKPNDFEVINPSTEEAFAIISLGSAEDADKAINAAKIAFETWRETTKESLFPRVIHLFMKQKAKLY